jgi:uncharacterized PurR-regulated membrane protein YhhQ (DUF165 family)
MERIKSLKEKNNYVLLVCLILTILLISTVTACRKTELIGIIATSNIIVYPITYVLVTYFRELYGSKKTLKLLNVTLVCTLVSILLIYFSQVFPSQGDDILKGLYESNAQTALALLTAFYFSQSVNLLIYNYLKYEKSIKFLLSSTIAVTLDSLVFAVIGNIGVMGFADIFKLFTGVYIFNAFSLIFYSLIFSLLVKGLEEPKEKEDKKKNKKIKKAQK